MVSEEIEVQKLIISSSILLSRLNALKSLIVKNPIIPILENFLFEVDHGMLRISASDIQVFLSTEVPIETKSDDFSCCVPAKLLTSLLAKLPEQPLQLLVTTEYLTVITFSGTYELPVLDSVDWPQSSEATPGVQFELQSEDLCHALEHTTFATSTDDLRPAMTCVCIESNLGLRFTATDGHRIVKVERPNAGVADFKALLPRKAAKVLADLLDDRSGPVEVEITPTTIVFTLSGFSLITRQVDESFPDTEGVFVHNPYQLLCHKSVLINALTTVLLFAPTTTGQVRFDISSPDGLTISSENLDYSRRAKEAIKGAEFDGDDMSIGFNGKLLLEMVEHIDGPMVELSLMGPSKGVTILERSVDNAEVSVTSLFMPLALNSF